MTLNKSLLYSLEEDMDDWNRAKLLHAAQTVFSNSKYLHLQQLLAGTALKGSPRHQQPGWKDGWPGTITASTSPSNGL